MSARPGPSRSVRPAVLAERNGGNAVPLAVLVLDYLLGVAPPAIAQHPTSGTFRRWMREHLEASPIPFPLVPTRREVALAVRQLDRLDELPPHVIVPGPRQDADDEHRPAALADRPGDARHDR